MKTRGIKGPLVGPLVQIDVVSRCNCQCCVGFPQGVGNLFDGVSMLCLALVHREKEIRFWFILDNLIRDNPRSGQKYIGPEMAQHF